MGPDPADGRNTAPGVTSNVLTQSGVIRSDIRTSFVGSSTTAAPGVPIRLTITVVNVNSACAALDSAGRLESAAAEYFFRRRLTGEQLEHSCCIAWATGGSLVPVQERQKFLSSYSL